MPPHMPTQKSERVASIEGRLLESKRNLNEIVELHTLCKDCKGSECLQAIQAAQRVWLKWIGDGEFSYHAARDTAKGDASKALATWQSSQYLAFVRILLSTMHSSDSTLQVASLHVLMSFVRHGSCGTIDQSLLTHVVRHAFCNRRFRPYLLDAWIKKYAEFDDVLMHSLNSIRQVIKLHNQQKEGGASSDDEADAGPSLPKVKQVTLCYNVLEVLFSLPAPKAEDSQMVLFAGEQGTEKSEGMGHTRKSRPAACTAAEVKKAAGRCGLQFLQLPLPKDVYKRVLLRMHSHVLPHLRSPLLLSDFLTRSYDVGGYTSVLALNGLFELMTRHNLEYPQFYKKLYNVLDSSVFLVRYRSRFFELLHICIVSGSKLPAYLCAAFAKRLCHLSLTAPPAGVMLAIALVHNMIQKHSALLPLVHRTELGVAEKDGSDPFNPTEDDPANCNALHSSLWELQAMKQHFCPSVRTMVSSFESPFAELKVKKFNVEDFVDETYEGLFETELTAKAKSCPLAFEKPASLFPASKQEIWALPPK